MKHSHLIFGTRENRDRMINQGCILDPVRARGCLGNGELQYHIYLSEGGNSETKYR
jgi:hypothetical protein